MFANIPSPERIARELFEDPSPSIPEFPSAWNAQLLLTPFGGSGHAATGANDQLLVANINVDTTRPGLHLMRANLYLLESLQYFDFLFVTTQDKTQWYWLVSDPARPNLGPRAAFGPFDTSAVVLTRDFLKQRGFVYEGSWRVVKGKCHNFTESDAGAVGTHFSFRSDGGELRRITNIDPTNPYRTALIGAYFLLSTADFKDGPSCDLMDVFEFCRGNARPTQPPSPMVTQDDVNAAFAHPPNGEQTPCSMKDINAVVGGLSVPDAGAIEPPVWNDTVEIFCYMLAKQSPTFYSRIWYDWNYGCQLAVFVYGPRGTYDTRLDEYLPKGFVGPSFTLAWKQNTWTPDCVDFTGGDVPMPVPNFVSAGQGRCRGRISNSDLAPENITIWSVALADDSGVWTGNFWYWFDDRARSVVFSLAPPHELTLVDYQDFKPGVEIDPAIFQLHALKECAQQAAQQKPKVRFV